MHDQGLYLIWIFIRRAFRETTQELDKRKSDSIRSTKNIRRIKENTWLHTTVLNHLLVPEAHQKPEGEYACYMDMQFITVVCGLGHALNLHKATCALKPRPLRVSLIAAARGQHVTDSLFVNYELYYFSLYSKYIFVIIFLQHGQHSLKIC